jgi:outer membrane protein assembly factor BamB
MMMHRNSFLFFVSVFMMFILISEATAASPWPMFMHDARHTGRSDYLMPDQVVVNWKNNFSTSAITGLSISNDENTIYAGSLDHYIYAIDALDGSVRWRYQADHSFVGSPAVDDSGNIYIGAKDDHLYCIDAGGTLNWKVQLDADAASSPVITPLGSILIATRQMLYAFSAQGVHQWTYPVGSESTPAVAGDGTIYMAHQGDLYAINSDGSPKWFFDLQEADFSSPAIGDDGTIYCAEGHMATNGHYALNAISPAGTLLWSYDLGDMPYLSNPGIAPDGTIFIGCEDYYVYAINADGSLKWKYLTSGSMNGSSFTIDGAGVVLTTHQTCGASLYALNPDGSEKWVVVRTDVDTNTCFVQTHIVGYGGAVYAGTDKGIVAFGGSSLATFNLSGTWTYTDTSVWDNCPVPEPAQSESLTVTQNGSDVQIVIDGKTFSGTLFGSICNVSGSYFEDGGTVTQNISLNLSSETAGLGSSTWVWSDGTNTCNGGSEFTFARQISPGNIDSSGGGGGGGCFIDSLFSKPAFSPEL